MKVKDLSGIFSNFTTVKIVENGGQWCDYNGYFIDIPEQYFDRDIELVIPIVNPDNVKTAMASILLQEK